MTKATPEDIKSLIDIFDNSDWSELHVQSEDFEIHLAKDPSARSRPRVVGTVPPEPAAGPPHSTPSAAVPDKVAASPSTPAAPAVPDGMLIVRAPNLGTFYTSPKPGAPPFVEIGQRVEADTEICVIEVMKLFTSVRAGVAGIVRQSFVKDADLVEFDQPLFLIEPGD